MALRSFPEGDTSVPFTSLRRLSVSENSKSSDAPLVKDPSGRSDHIKSKNDWDSREINGFCGEINTVALSGQVRITRKSFLERGQSFLPSSVMNTIRLPVQQEKQHLKAGEAGEASTSMSQRSLKYMTEYKPRRRMRFSRPKASSDAPDVQTSAPASEFLWVIPS